MRLMNPHKVTLIFKEYVHSIHAKASLADLHSHWHVSHGDNAAESLRALDDDNVANTPCILNDNDTAPCPHALDHVATHAPVHDNMAQSSRALDDSAPHSPRQ